jgi:hypothetical protein
MDPADMLDQRLVFLLALSRFTLISEGRQGICMNLYEICVE